MICKKPYMVGVIPCACGTCMPCRIARRRQWSTRMMLEAMKHGDSTFATLTYGDDKYTPRRSLNARDPQKWLKRLRKALAPQRIRYFLVGEYGEEKERAHYHAAIFGLSPVVAGGEDGRKGVIQSTWGKGFTYCGDLSWASAQYICGYVTKKLTNPNDKRTEAFLKGRAPEFARMSLNPGLGAFAMDDVARVLGTSVGLDDVALRGDVPHRLLLGQKSIPLGRYLRGKLREKIGFANSDVPWKAQARYWLQMRDVFEEAFKTGLCGNKGLGQIMVDINKQVILNLEARTKVHEMGKKL